MWDVLELAVEAEYTHIADLVKTFDASVPAANVTWGSLAGTAVSPHGPWSHRLLRWRRASWLWLRFTVLEMSTLWGSGAFLFRGLLLVTVFMPNWRRDQLQARGLAWLQNEYPGQLLDWLNGWILIQQGRERDE